LAAQNRFGGKEKRLAFGVYPDVSLAQARERRGDARKLLANDIGPSIVKQSQKASKLELAENSFEVVARDWFVRHAPNWKENHSSKIIARLEKDIFPYIGARPIVEIAAPALLARIRRIEARGALETAHRALACCGQVFRFAMPYKPDALSVILQATCAAHFPRLKETSTLLR